MSNSSYRIRTEPYSADQQIKIQLDQHYDQLNILSLTVPIFLKLQMSLLILLLNKIN